MSTEQIRQERQRKIDTKIARLRQQADRAEAEAANLSADRRECSAFWTQPAYGNAAGRAFAARRDRERNKMFRAGELYTKASDLRREADDLEAAGARVKGDAEAERQAKIARAEFVVGHLARTGYGDRVVVKVNAKTILIEGGFAPIKVCKSLAQPLPA
jgi:hypothetical protein